MKREIKFRAWTKKGEMQYNVVPFQWDYVIDRMWHTCIESNGNGILGSGGTEAKFEVGGFAIEEGNLMQFTGLKDKNGKEIYEGDIIRGTFTDQEGDNYGFVDYVTFEDGKFQCKNNADFDLWIYELEVIGNIYENPELIK